jgi:hypothetical protein
MGFVFISICFKIKTQPTSPVWYPRGRGHYFASVYTLLFKLTD